MESRDVQRKRYLLCVHCDPATYFDDLEELKKHWQRLHRDKVILLCGQCKSEFRHQTSLVRHITTIHVNACQDLDSDDEEDNGESMETNSPESHNNSREQQNVSNNRSDTFSEHEEEGGRDEVNEEIDFQDEAAKFLLKLRSSGNLTNASVELIQNFTSNLISLLAAHFKRKTKNFLEENRVNEIVSEKFLSETFQIGNPFQGLETTDKQLDYFSEKYGLVKPEEMYLSSRIEHRLDRTSKMFLPKQVSQTFQSFSLIGTLTLIARNKYLRELILSEKESTDGISRGYKDGTDFKNNTFLQKYPFAFRIELNYDDLETANGMGSKDVIHKIGPFYIRIQNLPAEENSKLSSIFLLAMAYSEDLKDKGVFKKILTPLLEDLKKLQSDEGVEITLPEGGTFIIRACLVCFCADSLAAHALFGFMGCSAMKFCRLCLLSLTDLQESSNSIGPLRTSETHKQHVADVERDPTLRSAYGVNEESALASVLRVPEDSVMDAFHDFVGVAQMVLKLVLYEFILVKKLFTVFYFNANIVAFSYGSPEIKNKPSANITNERLYGEGHTLKQNGSQTFCLLRIFPFLIKGVAEDDRFLELVFLLQDIMRIVFSSQVRPRDVDQLEMIIAQHNSLFHELFVPPPGPPPLPPTGAASGAAPAPAPEGPSSDNEENEENVDDPNTDDNESEPDDNSGASQVAPASRRKRKKIVHKTKRLKKGINKLHHILHYPKQFREKGPLIRLWCARYEGRHRILRKHSAVQSNFKNIIKTMSRMFQLSTFDAFLQKKKPETIISSTDSVQEIVQNSIYSDILVSEGLLLDDQVKIVKSVSVKGEEYACGLFVVCPSQNEPFKFGLIADVIVEVKDASKVYLVVQECVNEGLSNRYNSYKIRNLFEAPPYLLKIENLIDYRPLPAWTPMERDGLGLYLHPRNIFC
ncbi:uncharacterized protein LOC127751167 [Frankliniella occidentalis]|uniref:Uncharacterized protein LOC127751167 n=1 Tax=Frankliniella occidentalis TaxID=133901 RepID=A0A9C6XTT4_FRAOC|nr:uncharacterized protein LOC127751167 [Frankliniella occidentalis]